MKIKPWLFLALSLAHTTLTFAQKQNNNWLFGNGLGMIFNGASMSIMPEGTCFPGLSDPGFGSSTYSDPLTGALLFYTNGTAVYNKNHRKMPGGSGLLNTDASHHCYIVPHPGNSNLYYIFSNKPNTDAGIHYATVDMRLDGGLGDVTSKNNLLTPNADWAFTVVKRLYDQGYWIITHIKNSGSFLSFSIGKNGINPQGILSAAGVVSGSNNSWQQMASNNQGTEFAFSTWDQTGKRSIQLFSFDKQCGVASLSTTLEANITGIGFNALCAFSADDNFLYTYRTEGNAELLCQYRVSDPATDPNATKVVISSRNGSSVTDMQLAPDGKIYLCNLESNQRTSLHVINNPNNPGTACNFRPDQHRLSSSSRYYTTRLGKYIMDVAPPPVGYTRQRLVFTNTCPGDPVTFSLADPLRADSVRWHFGDGSSSTQRSPRHQYTQTRSYPVLLEWFLCNQRYEETDTVKFVKPEFNLGSDTMLCAGTEMILQVPPADEYRWSTGDTGNAIVADSPATYHVKVRIGGCWQEDEVEIGYYPPISTRLGDEFFICENLKGLVKLDAGEGFINYKWTPTRDTTQWIIVALAGDYYVVVKDFNGCSANDGTKVIKRCPVSIWFPNAFTPNNDELNERYEPRGTDVLSFHLVIYNRWGETVFESNDLSHTWDGTHNNKPAPSDTYIYLAGYSGYASGRLQHFEKKGNITLQR